MKQSNTVKYNQLLCNTIHSRSHYIASLYQNVGMNITVNQMCPTWCTVYAINAAPINISV